jgi:hypothetical protein
MTPIGKLSALLDDPEVYELIFGLAHVGSAPQVEPGPPRLRAVVLRLARTTDPDQYGSWLSDDASNRAMTLDQVLSTIGEDAVNDLALLAKCSPGVVAWQLAAVLPYFVDAVTPGGVVIDADRFAAELVVTNRIRVRSL